MFDKTNNRYCKPEDESTLNANAGKMFQFPDTGDWFVIGKCNSWVEGTPIHQKCLASFELLDKAQNQEALQADEDCVAIACSLLKQQSESP